jgi:holliday junction DNA helicase RuvB
MSEEIRPQHLSEYHGQDQVRNALALAIRAAMQKSAILDHVLLIGPPGLGKTTLAQIIANEMHSKLHTIFGPSVKTGEELNRALKQLSEGDVLFIDELHRLAPAIEETLYTAMEDFTAPTKTYHGALVMLDLPRFTLVGATTRPGLITRPLRDRFGIIANMEFYSEAALTEITQRSAEVLKLTLAYSGAQEIARRSRGTPRVANRLLRRVRDFAGVHCAGEVIDQWLADKALEFNGVDNLGLDIADRKYLDLVVNKYNGGPVGLVTLASVLNEEKDSLEEVIEPYLLRIGFIDRTPRGRVATESAYKYMQQRKAKA